MRRHNHASKDDRLRLSCVQASRQGVDVVVALPLPAWFAVTVASYASTFLGALAWSRYLDRNGLT